MNRIIDNYITSILGIIITGVAIYCQVKGIIDDVAFYSLISNALIMFRAKDTLIGGESK